MRAPLIPARWRTRAIGACAVAAAGFAALAVLVAGGHSTTVDSWMFDELYEHIGAGGAAVLLGFSAPALSISICALVGLVALLLRRWDIAALAALGPALTVVLTKFVFKPLLGRQLAFGDFHVTGVFPSGHESAVAATAWLLVLVTRQLPVTVRLRALVLTGVAVWTVVAALGLVRNFWHYPTDTIGSLCLATVVVLGLAVLLDRFGPALERRLPAQRAAGRLARRS